MGMCARSFFAVAKLRTDSVARGQQVLHIGNLLFLAFNFGCAYAPTAADLLVDGQTTSRRLSRYLDQSG